MTTFLVAVGFSTGAGVDPTYLRLDDPVAGLLDTGVLAPSGLTTDISTDQLGRQRVMSFAIDRSSTQAAGALVEYAAGTLSLTLRDDAGDLDPATIGEPIPGVSISLSAVWSGGVYPLFTGTVDSWLPSLLGPDQAVVQVTASDALATLAGVVRGDSVPLYAGDTSSTRVGRILDAAGWSAGRRSIDTGTTTLAATTMGGNALDLLRQVARAEVGDLWATPTGVIRFRSRYGLYTSTLSSTSQATFGSDRAGGELPYVSLETSYDRTDLINVVRAGRDGGTVYESGDAPSRSRYGDHAEEQTDLPLADDTQVAAWADYVRARDAVPKLRFTELQVDVRADDASYYPQVLVREFGDRITVVRRPPGVVDSRDQYIRAIHHAFTAPNAWQATYGLEEAPSGSPLILDDAVRGLLDSHALIY